MRGSSLDLYVSANPKLAGKLAGLYGNFDADPGNEWTTPDGTVLDMGIGTDAWKRLHRQFGPAWRVVQKDLHLRGPSVWDPAFSPGPAEQDSMTATKRKWAEGICRATGISTEPSLANCIIDVGLTGDITFASSNAEGAALQQVPAAAPPTTFTGTTSVGQVITGELTEPGQRREYTLKLTQGQIVYLTGDKSNCARTVRYAIVKPNGPKAAAKTACDDAGRFVAERTGTHTVLVSGAKETGTGPYSIDLIDVPADSNRALTVPGEATGSLSRLGERHLYLLSLTEGQIIHLRGDQAGCSDDAVRYTVIKPNRTRSAENTACGDTDQFVADTTGTHTLQVYGAKDAGTGRYLIQISPE